ncbi:MAG: hypothetical protein KJ025_17175 [Burkholderiales bacterium]|nr:hypothetical protein [Burkholderiales bacterium]
MWLRWIPWRQVVSRVARSRGLVDPVELLARLESFAQPVEVKEPLELLRAGIAFHARGLMNSAAIQHNLDWVWPYWVERQYDPHDVSFVPRAFSLTHINLTHRSWTAIGLPDCDEIPIVDPRGLLTPFWDGWSLDVWLVRADGARLLPSRHDRVAQRLDLDGGVAVITECAGDGMGFTARAEVLLRDATPVCTLALSAGSARDATLVVALRPYNPEGVSFVRRVACDDAGHGWRVDERHAVRFDAAPARYVFSDYHSGDVLHRLGERDERRELTCRVGLATAAALFEVRAAEARAVRVEIPLAASSRAARRARPEAHAWSAALAGRCRLAVPDARFVQLYEAAVRSVVLHSQPDEVYPGPYTYKRFWFRDCAFILHAMLCLGLEARVERVLDTYPDRQRRDGFFFSQETEWDSNGEALWIMRRFTQLAGRKPKRAWRKAIRRGAEWIIAKRRPADGDAPHAGLLPAGFSAEHLGPSDYYYWDDFWAVAGLRAAAEMLAAVGQPRHAAGFTNAALDLVRSIDRSLEHAARRLGRPAMPASPYRRMDAGAIGSLAAGYPLELHAAYDERLRDTVEFLLEHCFVGGCFFQDMIHSGLNPYLTLHVAQVLLRAGDERALALVREVAARASPTCQWPEAIHPHTGGGCMGDGHHVWASAEWVLMMRSLFVREEAGALVLGSGVFPEWLAPGEPLAFGPTPTPHGPVTVRIAAAGHRPGDAGPTRIEVTWDARWRGDAPRIEVRLPGWRPARAPEGASRLTLERAEAK